MATIKCKISALGNEDYKCPGCEKKFKRGQQMSAVVYDNGELAGWLCDECIKKWKSGALFE